VPVAAWKKGAKFIESDRGTAQKRAADVQRVDAASELPRTRAGLFSGEAEAIPLAARHGCTVLLDDLAARRAAGRAGIEVVGSLGLLILAKREGIIAGIAPLIERMRNAGIRFAQPLIERALREVNEM
jgi:predicted nucleic acid-binding protein